MKLSTLKESLPSSINVFNGKFPLISKYVEGLLSTFHGMKLEHDSDDDSITLVFSNGLTVIDFECYFDPNAEEEDIRYSDPNSYSINLIAHLDPDILYFGDDLSKYDFGCQLIEQDFVLTDKNFDARVQSLKEIKGIIDSFSEWYLEISGEYSNVKVIRALNVNMNRGLGSSSKNIIPGNAWIPYLGFFSSYKATVSSVDGSKIEKEVVKI